MNEIIKPSGDEVLVECCSLSAEERDDLETFLAAQPEVQRIARRMRTTDAPQGGTLGFLVAHIDLVVHVGEAALLFVAQTGAVAFINAKVNEWAKERAARGGQEEREEENAELIPILGPDGHTVKVVRKQK